MRSILTKKLMAVLLAVCMIAALMPVGVFAADSATQTADFTTGECNKLTQSVQDRHGSGGLALGQRHKDTDPEGH